ncbi:MAG: hypothetical protein K2K97_04160 [Muribaculaceae bacterium]|nr:hypothetical protein [Muribaculaceae bacterium]
MLGAYLEGNLHGSEFREISNLMHDESIISDLVGVVESDVDFLNDINYSFIQGIESTFVDDDLIGSLSIPDITSYDPEMRFDPSSITDDITIGANNHNFVGENCHFLHLNHDDEHNAGHHLNHHDSELDFGGMDNIE